MIFKWGRKSSKNRILLVTGLIRVADRALGYGIMDFMIDCSFRNEYAQNMAYEDETSKVRWPYSKHNKLPTPAMDCVPIINGGASWNKVHCVALSGLILAAGKEEGINLRWGGNWDMDSEPITDQDFQDLVHYEEF